MAELNRYDRYIVRKVLPFCNAVRHLGPECYWKSEALCCLFWYQVHPRKHTKIGKRLYWLSERRHLPLRCVDKASDRALLYSVRED